MATPQETFERTMDTYTALTLYRAFKEYQDLVESGVDSATAFMQAFWGVYTAAPDIPRPGDPILSVSALLQELKDAHAHLSKFNQEAKDAVVYMEKFIKKEPPK